MANEERIVTLITKYLKNDLSEDERKELYAWRETNEKLFERLTNTAYLSDKLEDFSKIDEQAAWKTITGEKFPAAVVSIEINRDKRPLYKCMGWAAAVLLLFGAGVVCWYNFHSAKDKLVTTGQKDSHYQNDIAPGSNKATLTLKDGSVIIIDEKPSGLIARQASYVIMKERDSLVTYTPRLFDEPIDLSDINTISTPAGGNFRVKLPDGSAIWLNAGSSVSFNPRFPGNTRKVQVTGQVYFEVAHRANPFVVAITASNGTVLGEVQVLGTHFSINAYDNDSTVNTTLLQGSIKIKTASPGSKWAKLKPGQQGQIAKNNLLITDKVNMEEVVAWKEGNFFFDHITIKQAMQQVARWYNAEVQFEVSASKSIVAAIPKNQPVSNVLKILELTGGVHFRVEGNKIVVTN